MYGAIAAGSGIGGLITAGLLARIAGKRVLMLEKHTESGELTHTFRHDNFSWDVGLHHTGQLEPGSPLRVYLDYLLGDELVWNRVPDTYDHFVYPGIDFSAPSDPAEYQRKLTEAFPAKTHAIHRYFRGIRNVNRWNTFNFIKHMVPGTVAPLLRDIQRISGRIALGTTQRYLKRRFRSPRLQTLLASQWGDYELPPSLGTFVTHTMIVGHYLNGTWSPESGSARAARTFEKSIERAGGVVRVTQDVQKILVENRRTVGAWVLGRRGPITQERIHRAPVMISSAGIPVIFFDLLPTDGPVEAATAGLRDAIRRIGIGTPAAAAYLGLRDDPCGIEVTGGNVRVSRDLDHDDLPDRSTTLLSGSPENALVSFPPMKSDETHHTAKIVSFVDADTFKA